MPWIIRHKCPHDPGNDNANYSVGRSTGDGPKLTRFRCPECQETFFIEGHEFADAFQRAQNDSQISGIPGLVLPRQTGPIVRVKGNG